MSGWAQRDAEAKEELAGEVDDLRATIARLERELVEARRIQPVPLDDFDAMKAKAESLDALADFTNSGPICGRKVVICESHTRDRPFWRVEAFTARHKFSAEHSTLAAAIMDVLGKVQS